MKILIFDTETTGLVLKDEPNLDKQPRICQFARIIWELSADWTWKKEKEINYLIDPGIEIPPQTSQIHWIWTIDVKGKPKFKDLYKEIIDSINSVDYIVAHNIRFDESLLSLEIQRLKKEWIIIDYMPKGKICTMIAGTPICKLPKKNWFSQWYKAPKLMEIFHFYYWKYFKWAHDAMVDVKACWLVLQKMVEKKHINLERIENNQINLC